MSRYLWTILFLFALIGLSGVARAQDAAPSEVLAPAGSAFTYQGQLKDASGPVTATCDFQFGLWDTLASGTQVGSTLTRTGVAVSEGLFTVQLDFGVNAFTGSARWLEIAVRCPAGNGVYNTLSPRQPLTPTPYSLYSANAGTAANLSGVLPVSNGGTGSATKNFVDLSTDQPVGGVKTFSNAPSFAASGAPFSVSSTGVVANLNADTLDGQHASAFASSAHTHWGESWSGSGTGLTLSGDTGLVASGNWYGVRGKLNYTTGSGIVGEAYATTGFTYGVWGISSSTSGKGVYGFVDATAGNTYGVFGQANSTDGIGVYGATYATTGQTYGVFGESDSTIGTGVSGYAGATSGGTIGVKGQSQSTSGMGVYGYDNATTGVNYGVYGQVISTSGVGVYGVSNAATGTTFGVYGMVSSPSGIGVSGVALATSGTTYGVFGWSQSTEGVGVWGEADNGYSFGVEGYSPSTNGTGVYGLAASTSGYSAGVWGMTDSPQGWGVYGQASCYNCNWGVFSNGNLYVTGSATIIGIKSAAVQTQDYGWVDLHSMESPRVLFEDVNTAQLINGQAVVTIDPVFAQTVELTQTYQVFLTPGGDCSLYVSSKTPTTFTVSAQGRQSCSISFDYRIIAVRKGYADTRLEPAEDPKQVTRLANSASVLPDGK